LHRGFAGFAKELRAAQERGEVVGPHSGASKRVSDENPIAPATLQELGLTKTEIYEARLYRDAEKRYSPLEYRSGVC